MKLILAPMATLSHQALRELIYSFSGCDEYYTEMIHAPSFLHGGKFEHFYASSSPEPQKLVWQLTGSTKESLASCASRLMMDTPKEFEGAILGQPYGDSRALGIDINMGCCAPDIFKQGSGIAWMCKPLEETASMLRLLRKSFTGRLSCKIRLGDEGFSDDSFYSFLDMLVDNGVEQIVLHPRSRREKISRPPRLFYIEKAAQWVHKKKSSVKLIGNGAIFSLEDYKRFCLMCPSADGVMIGRAAVQKPWIFSQIAAYNNGIVYNQEDSVDLLKTAELFIEYLKNFQPREFYKTRAQRFFSYYCDNVSFAHHLKTNVLNADSLDDMLNEIDGYFKKMSQERFVTL